MTLLWPPALLGLLALPVILALHLRHRRTEVTVSSLRWWQDLPPARAAGAPRRIPASLLLALQLLAATALALALARPARLATLPLPRHTIFILDTTTSMAAAGSGGSRFEAARQVIQRHLQNLGAADSVAVVSLGPQPEILFNGTAAQTEALPTVLANLTPGATGVNLGLAVSLANGLVNPERRTTIVALTDGNFAVEPEQLPPALAPIDWPLLPAAGAANLALLDVSAQTLPTGDHRLLARLANYSAAPAQPTLRVLANGQPFAEEAVLVTAQSEAVRLWTLPASAQTAAVELTNPADDALPADNRADLFLAARPLYRVLLLSDNPAALARALQAQPGVKLTVAAPQPWPPALAGYDLLVFDGLPSQLTDWPPGPALVVNPPSGHPLLNGAAPACDLRPQPVAASPVLAGVDLSGVDFGCVSAVPLPGWAALDLLAAAGGQTLPLIFHGSPRPDAPVAVWAFDVAAGNLPGRLALPLLTANTLAALLVPPPPAVIPAGRPVRLPGDFSVETPAGRRLFLEPMAAAMFARTQQPGLYQIYNRQNEPVAGFAVHAGSPEESNLSRPALPAQLAALAVTPADLPAPPGELVEYWPWLAGATLLLVLLEGGLAWRK